MPRLRFPSLMRAIAAVLALGAPATAPAHAQLVVTDPLNLIQTALNAARALEQIDNQATQIVNQVKQLANEAKNLQGLGQTFAPDFMAKLQDMDRLIDEARGVALKVNDTRNALDTLFKGDYRGTDIATRARLAAQQIDAARAALQSSMLIQAKVIEQIRDDQSTLQRLTSASGSATGALSAQQATNEILAFQAEQSMRLQSLLAAQSRADAMAKAQEMEVRAQGAAQRDHFFSTAATAYAGQKPWN